MKVQEGEHRYVTRIIKSQARYQKIGTLGLLSVHGAVVVNGHTKRLISGSFPDVMIFRPLGTWRAHSHSIYNLREKRQTLRILHTIFLRV